MIFHLPFQGNEERQIIGKLNAMNGSFMKAKDSLLNQHNEKSLLENEKFDLVCVRIVCKWVLLLLSSWPNVCLLIELCMKCGRY